MGRFIEEEMITSLQEALDEKWSIANGFKNSADMFAYNGMIRTVLALGFDFDRDDDGKHTVYGNYAE